MKKTFYHATEFKYEENIKKKGLLPVSEWHSIKTGNKRGVIYLSERMGSIPNFRHIVYSIDIDVEEEKKSGNLMETGIMMLGTVDTPEWVYFKKIEYKNITEVYRCPTGQKVFLDSLPFWQKVVKYTDTKISFIKRWLLNRNI